MGSLTVIPDMDTSRPASVDPAAFVEVANRWKITQSFASPAVWRKVTDYCMAEGKVNPDTSAGDRGGSPLPDRSARRLLKDSSPQRRHLHPVRATESLPVASIGAREILAETAVESRNGKGTCVGKRFEQIKWRVIPITDEPIGTVRVGPRDAPR
jgi:hypothetical protein